MIEIPLSKKGKHAGKYVALVDDEDRDLAELNWALHSTNKPFYAARRVGNKRVLLHVIIMGEMLGHPVEEGFEVDHINGDGLDCRRSNLRIATHAENMQNQKSRSGNALGLTGVHWSAKKGRYVAQIGFSYRKIHIGYFDNPQLAHEAYLKKARELYGKFARLDNRSDEDENRSTT